MPPNEVVAALVRPLCLYIVLNLHATMTKLSGVHNESFYPPAQSDNEDLAPDATIPHAFRDWRVCAVVGTQLHLLLETLVSRQISRRGLWISWTPL